MLSRGHGAGMALSSRLLSRYVEKAWKAGVFFRLHTLFDHSQHLTGPPICSPLLLRFCPTNTRPLLVASPTQDPSYMVGVWERLHQQKTGTSRGAPGKAAP